MKKLFCVPVLLLILITACKKEDKRPNSELILGSWSVIAHTSSPGYDYNNDGIIETDIYSAYKACEKDNFITFKKEGQLLISDQGTEKCRATEPQTNSTNWILSHNQDTITTYYGSALILQLDDKTLTSVESDSTDSGVETETITYKRK